MCDLFVFPSDGFLLCQGAGYRNPPEASNARPGQHWEGNSFICFYTQARRGVLHLEGEEFALAKGIFRSRSIYFSIALFCLACKSLVGETVSTNTWKLKPDPHKEKELCRAFLNSTGIFQIAWRII